MLSDTVRKLLASRGITDDIATVRDYECGETCGTGPRVIIGAPGRVDVCYNLEELTEKLDKYSSMRERDLVDLLVI